MFSVSEKFSESYIFLEISYKGFSKERLPFTFIILHDDVPVNQK
jgi:hypothetical protein